MLAKDRLDHFLFEEYQANSSSLGVYRVLYASSILALYLPQHLWIPSFPDSFFDPPVGFTIFFSGFPPASYFIILNMLSVAAASSLFVGYRTRLASCSLAFLLIAGNVWSYSFGKINNDIFLVLIPLVLAFSGWGDAYSVDQQRKAPVHPSQNAWPVALLALLVGFAMMTAAYGKATTGWLDFRTHAALAHLTLNSVVAGRETAVGSLMFRVQSGVFWELLDYMTIILEASFLLVVANRRAFRVVCALACFFHFGIALTMRIPFWPNVLAYAAFYDWSGLTSRKPARRAVAAFERFVTWLTPLMVGSLALIVSVAYVTAGNPLLSLAGLIGPEPESTVGYPPLILGVVVASAFLVGEIGKAFAPARPGEVGRIILFDGRCGLCNKWVDFVFRYDTRGLYRFAALQSDAGQRTLEKFAFPSDFIDSLVLVEGEGIFTCSSAVLRILRSLGPPFSLMFIFVVVPKRIRDRAYKFVANHRHQWFGARDVCRLPTPEERSRFL
jgi:predicted DCC family thiol-disulfide oxidoreductase YuxK/uncharacterized membrane protein YphA (DoxX/SURF4 family)